MQTCGLSSYPQVSWGYIRVVWWGGKVATLLQHGSRLLRTCRSYKAIKGHTAIHQTERERELYCLLNMCGEKQASLVRPNLTQQGSNNQIIGLLDECTCGPGTLQRRQVAMVITNPGTNLRHYTVNILNTKKCRTKIWQINDDFFFLSWSIVWLWKPFSEWLNHLVAVNNEVCTQ